MTPGSLVRIVDRDWDGIWVDLPNGKEEWLEAPFLPAVYLGPTTSHGTSSTSPRRGELRSEILYGGRVLVVPPDAIIEARS